VGSRLEVFCWLAFGVYICVVSLRWAFCKLQLVYSSKVNKIT
jgi:hypothetical protein